MLLSYISRPVGTAIVDGLDGPHSGLPVLVAEVIPHSVGLSTRAEQTAEVALSLQVLQGEKQQDAEQYHRLANFLVVSPPAGSPLHEEEEVGDVVSHLGSGGGSAVLELEHSVVELSGHTDDHVIEVAVW